jgi:phenylacetic acid degradation operon negative regulatory protein
MTAVGATIPTRTLILGMVDGKGSLDAERLFEVAQACGMSDEQVRLCLRRLVAAGSIEHLAGRGRRASYQLPPGAESQVLPEAGFLEFALR